MKLTKLFFLLTLLSFVNSCSKSHSEETVTKVSESEYVDSLLIKAREAYEKALKEFEQEKTFYLGGDILFSPGYSYKFLLNIQDASGNEKLKDFPLDKTILKQDFTLNDYTASFNIDEPIFVRVSLDLYKLEVMLPKPCEPFLNDSVYVPTNSGGFYVPVFIPDNNRILTVGRMGETDKHYYLMFYETTSGQCSPAEKIAHKLTSFYIFGDYAEHLIVSFWKPRVTQLEWGPLDFECYRIQIDGKEFSLESYNTPNNLNDYWANISVAWVVWE